MAQDLKDYRKSIRFKDIKGMEITITTLKNEKKMFYNENPDTIWIKKVKNPRLNKHYKVAHIYKGVLSENGLDYYTPAETIIGRTFLVEDISYNAKEADAEIPSNFRYDIITCKLKDLSTGEIIIMKIKDVDSDNSLRFIAKDRSVYNSLAGKKYVNSYTEEFIEIKDCFYNFKYLWLDSDIEIKTTDGNTIYPTYFDSYITPEAYEQLQKETERKKIEAQWKQIEKEAMQGSYKMHISSVQKPKSSKFAKGELVNTDKSMVYTDNYTSLIVMPQDDNFFFSLNNKSQSNIEIDWDRIIYIDENNHSGRVIHSGIKYTERNSPQTPSLVAPTTSITDVIIPVNNIYLSTVSYEWRISSLINNANIKGSHDGKNIKIILPIKIDGASYEYSITYNLVWEWKNPTTREKWLKHINEK